MEKQRDFNNRACARRKRTQELEEQHSEKREIYFQREKTHWSSHQYQQQLEIGHRHHPFKKSPLNPNTLAIEVSTIFLQIFQNNLEYDPLPYPYQIYHCSEMGLSRSKQIKENMHHNLESLKEFQVELLMKQRQMMLATRRAMGREVFKYYFGFFITYALGVTYFAFRTGKKHLLLSLLPFSVLVLFQYDLSYGPMLSRARLQAFGIIRDESQMLYPPWNNSIMSPMQYQRKVPYARITKSFDSEFSQS